MPKISLPNPRKGWAIAGGAALGLGALFFAATSLMDGDDATPRVAPEAASTATPPAPEAPANSPAQSAAPVLPTTFYNIGERAAPVPLFTEESRASTVIGYITGCFSTNDAPAEMRGIKIVTPEGEHNGFITVRGARAGTFVPNTDATGADCRGTVTAAEDLPITEGYYRMAAGSDLLHTPWEGGGINGHFDVAVCVKVIDAVNNDHANFAQVYFSVEGIRIPYTGWARYSSIVRDEHCGPETP